MAAGTVSAERVALTRCNTEVISLLQHNILSVSSSLFAKGLITDGLYQWVLTAQGVSSWDKAARVVTCISDVVDGSPRKFNAFVGMLREDPYYEDVLGKLTTAHCKLSHVSAGCANSSLKPSPF